MPGIYVGNLPNSFTEEDLWNVFQAYEGICVRRLIKKDKKTYGFLTCADHDQVEEIIGTLGGTFVGGRKLVIRPNDETDRESRNESSTPRYPTNGNQTTPAGGRTRQQHNRTVEYRGANPQQYVDSDAYSADYSSVQGTYDAASYPPSQSDYQYLSEQESYPANYSPYPVAHGTYGTDDYQYPYDASHYQHGTFADPYSLEHESCTSDGYPYLSEDRSHVSNSLYPSEYGSCTSDGYPYLPEDKSHVSNYPSEYESQDDYQYPPEHRSRASSYPSEYGNGSRKVQHSDTCSSFSGVSDDKEYSFLNVSNFRYGTSKREIYQLFSDYRPRKVWMLNNVPDGQGSVTEAIVCFEDAKDAEDAILNLDNTIYERRTLLVVDAKDKSIVAELLSVSRNR